MKRPHRFARRNVFRRYPLRLTARNDRPRVARMRLSRALALALVLPAAIASAQAPTSYPLESAAGLRLHNVTAEPATLDGKKGLRLTLAAGASSAGEQLAVIEGLEFSSGVIEAELAGAPGPGAAEGARGFVGIAFRLQADNKTYDAFYLRPTNGRADDQVRRNHSTQYSSHPDFSFAVSRQQAPEKYESYVDLEPGVWTRYRITVEGTKARLYVNGAAQPCLIVNDLKLGDSSGGVLLWIGPGTEGYFSGLDIKASTQRE